MSSCLHYLLPVVTAYWAGDGVAGGTNHVAEFERPVGRSRIFFILVDFSPLVRDSIIIHEIHQGYISTSVRYRYSSTAQVDVEVEDGRRYSSITERIDAVLDYKHYGFTNNAYYCYT